MEIEGKGLGVVTEPSSDGTICSTPGCDHVSQGQALSKAEAPAGRLCDCCRRRSLERRLADLQVEINLLPGEIKRLPRHCLHEVRPDYENIST